MNRLLYYFRFACHQLFNLIFIEMFSKVIVLLEFLIFSLVCGEFLKTLPIVLALFPMLSEAYCAKNYTSIISLGLSIK